MSFQRIPSATRVEHFDALAGQILRDGVARVTDPAAFIRQFNREWTVVRGYSGVLPVKATIRFSSQIPGLHIFSNFYPTLILDQGQVFYSAEHHYQYFSVLGLSPSVASQIRESTDALKVKQVAKTIKASAPTTKKEKLGLMKNALFAKFSQNEILARQLLGTADRPMSEATKDQFGGARGIISASCS